METTPEETLSDRLYDTYSAVCGMEDEITVLIQTADSDYLRWALKVTREARDSLYEASSAIRFQKSFEEKVSV